MITKDIANSFCWVEYRQNKRPIRGHSTYPPGVRQCRKAAEAAATKQINQIASEEWFNLLINHDFPTAGISLVGVDLSGNNKYLRHRENKGLDLSQSLFLGANLKGAQLQSADLFGAQLQGTDLSDTQLQAVNLSKAQLQSAKLIDTQLQGANLIETQLQGACLWKAQLQGANFIYAQL